MTYGYLRVSTVEQDNNKFQGEILLYSNKNHLGHVSFIEEKVTGVKDWKSVLLLKDELTFSELYSLYIRDCEVLQLSGSDFYLKAEVLPVSGVGVLYLPVKQRKAVFVPETAACNQDYVNKGPDSETAESQKHKDSRADFSDIEPMCSEFAEEEGQENGNQSAIR